MSLETYSFLYILYISLGKSVCEVDNHKQELQLEQHSSKRERNTGVRCLPINLL